MEEQVPPSQDPGPAYNISPEQLEAMKAYAREQAVRMTYQQPPLPTQPPQGVVLSVPQAPVANVPYQPSTNPFRPDIPQMQRAPEPAYDYSAPKVIYVARNFTIAELLVIGLLSCTVAFGLLKAWDFGSKYLPQIEVRVK